MTDIPMAADSQVTPFGLAMSDAELTAHYEASKRDVVGLLGSQVRQMVAEIRYHRRLAHQATPASGELATELRRYAGHCAPGAIDRADLDGMAFALEAAAKRLDTLEAWANGPHGVRWYIDRLAALSTATTPEPVKGVLKTGVCRSCEQPIGDEHERWCLHTSGGTHVTEAQTTPPKREATPEPQPADPLGEGEEYGIGTGWWTEPQPAASNAVREAIALLKDTRDFLADVDYEDLAGDLQNRIDRYLDAAQPLPEPQTGAGLVGWHQIDDQTPRDGTLLELVVDYSDGGGPLHDAIIAPTIGFNNLANDGEDRWQFAGWCWTHDHFTAGNGKVIAWRPSRLNAFDDGLSPISHNALQPSNEPSSRVGDEVEFNGFNQDVDPER